jgi:hypothetical protein
MLRGIFAGVLLFVVLILGGFRRAGGDNEGFELPVNSMLADVRLRTKRSYVFHSPRFDLPQSDSSKRVEVLMLNHSAYDSLYADKIARIVRLAQPSVLISEFWSDDAAAFSAALGRARAVLVAYPFAGTPATVRAFGKVLQQYVRQGGVVVFTGTHKYSVLQQFGLFDLDFGYFCKDIRVHETDESHPVWAGVPQDFSLSDFTYPLDVSDPAFVTLADVRGYPVLGYKPLGEGRVFYVGMEYYHDEPMPKRVLTNLLQWAVFPPEALPGPASGIDAPAFKRSEEVLYTGSGSRMEGVELKLYPNPYASKATLEFELTKPTVFSAEVADENGRIINILLPRRTLGTGLYRLEMPNIPPGAYFVHCQVGDKKEVRKIIKLQSR